MVLRRPPFACAKVGFTELWLARLDSGTTLLEVAKNLTSVRATVLPMSLQSALAISGP